MPESPVSGKVTGNLKATLKNLDRVISIEVYIFNGSNLTRSDLTQSVGILLHKVLSIQ